MFVLTINDRVGGFSGFPGVRAFIGCADYAGKIVARIRLFGWSVSMEEVPFDKLPVRSEAEKETVARLMEIVHPE